MPIIRKGNPQDIMQEEKTPKMSKFPMKEQKNQTYRFGEIGVHLVKNGVTKDSWKIRSAHEVDSYTLGAPLKTQIGMHKDYVFVPRMAILPNAWDLIITNPTIGDDIDATMKGTSVPAEIWTSFLRKIAEDFANSFDYLINDADTVAKFKAAIKDFFIKAIRAEMVFSWGNLLANLDAPMSELWISTEGKYFDEVFDKIIADIVNCGLGEIQILDSDSGKTYHISMKEPQNFNTDVDHVYYSVRQFLEKLREGDFYSMSWDVKKENGTGPTDSDITTWTAEIEQISLFDTDEIEYNEPFDLARLWAYQISVSEFFTNDKIDHIYSANLYRQYIHGLEMLKNDNKELSYNLNGIQLTADACSAEWFNKMINDGAWTGLAGEYIHAYLISLFSYKRSLKYCDYFTGARKRPLAVGDTHVPVQSGTYVDVVDISKNIQAQRFKNVINRIGRKAEEYTKGLFGITVAHDWHDPLWLASTDDIIGAREVENTGEGQLQLEQSVTSRLQSLGANYEMSYDLDRYGIILGLTWFDIERAYYRGVDRSFMQVDRFDYFNTYMQYTGDQQVYAEELTTRKHGNFGYQNCYAEFKQSVNRATGGFIMALKGWTFLDQVFNNKHTHNTSEPDNINSDYIRSKASEFDRFFLLLTGYSMGTYFHFIIKNTNVTEAVRPMAIDPQILG